MQQMPEGRYVKEPMPRVPQSPFAEARVCNDRVVVGAFLAVEALERECTDVVSILHVDPEAFLVLQCEWRGRMVFVHPLSQHVECERQSKGNEIGQLNLWWPFPSIKFVEHVIDQIRGDDGTEAVYDHGDQSGEILVALARLYVLLELAEAAIYLVMHADILMLFRNVGQGIAEVVADELTKGREVSYRRNPSTWVIMQFQPFKSFRSVS